MVRPRIVIAGGGFGGIAAAQALRRADVDVVVIDRTNHFVFQPLLYQVASGTLSPGDIAVPIRWYLRAQANTRVEMAEATSVDPAAREVILDGGARRVPYDFLVLACGGRHAYFGHDEWEPSAPGLKTLSDALCIRDRFLEAFERAETAASPEVRDVWQTMVIIGGGPTGVELAGIMRTMAAEAMRRDFRRIDTARTRVVLVEGGVRLLPTFPASLGERARRDLEAMGVEVRLQAMAREVTGEGVWIGDEFLASRTVFWAAGNAASPIGRSLGAPADRQGRIVVAPDLSVPGHPEIFVVGDMASMTQADGRPVPGVAQGALQGGRAAADNILRSIRGESRRPFRYRNRGDMATIGRHRAVADLGVMRFGGTMAWLLWVFLHIVYLAGFRNRLVVFVQWGWEYVTYQKGARLIREARGGEARRPPHA